MDHRNHPLPLERGDEISFTGPNGMFEGNVSMASPNHASLLIRFSGLSGGYVDHLPLIWMPHSGYECLSGKPYTVTLLRKAHGAQGEPCE